MSLALLLLSLLLLPACSSPSLNLIAVQSTSPASWQIPPSVHRLAVVTSRPNGPESREAYGRLEAGVFRLTVQRPSLTMVERAELVAILTEQRLQLGGVVQDESAIRVGRLTGADAVLLFQIDGLSQRERLLARMHDELPAPSVVSKLIKVETGEVLYLNAVTARLPPLDRESVVFAGQPWIRAALDQCVAQTLSDLHAAFR